MYSSNDPFLPIEMKIHLYERDINLGFGDEQHLQIMIDSYESRKMRQNVDFELTEHETCGMK